MDINTIEKELDLEGITSKKNSLEKTLSEPNSISGNIGEVASELSYYTKLHSFSFSISKMIKDYREILDIIVQGPQNELYEIALSEKSSLEEQIDEQYHKRLELEIEHELGDPDDNRSVLLEIRAGAGGEEAALFAADLFKMYTQYGSNKGWAIELVDSNVNDNGGFKEVVAHIKGANAYKALKYESGVHRVQRVPITESSGRIHTSTASVAIMPEAREIDIQIDPQDLRIDVMRATGAGGQNVNRTDSAVRITHLPSGIVVSCQETKHQDQNKEKAMNLLRSRLYDKKKQEEDEKRSKLRSSQIGNSMRAEKIRTYNFPQTRVTDHRIKKSWFNIDMILAGDIGEMLEETTKGIQKLQLEQRLKEKNDSK
ncbi:peptide chain release factor 1 [Candidatus Dojkabacteria bacterium]|nr:peptide chain release factor 1 [Candidatus Dojkabacteria bacterium]